MRRLRAAPAALALLILGACGPDPLPLPFYRDADLTPEWLTAAEAEGEGAHHIADFTLTNQLGAEVTQAALEGHITVASFFFVDCGEICPPIQAQVARVREAYEGSTDVLMVSHSVRPRDDTQAVLKTYGDHMGIDPGGWHLLTGEEEVIHDLAEVSYFVELEDGSYHGVETIAHTENVVLLDPELRIRGVYNGTLAFEMDQLIQDIAVLREELDLTGSTITEDQPLSPPAASIHPHDHRSSHQQGRSS